MQNNRRNRYQFKRSSNFYNLPTKKNKRNVIDFKTVLILIAVVIAFSIAIPVAFAETTKIKLKEKSKQILEENSSTFVKRYHVYTGLKKSAKKLLTLTKSVYPKETKFQRFLENIIMNNFYVEIAKMKQLDMFQFPRIEKGIELNLNKNLKNTLTIRGGNSSNFEIAKIFGLVSIFFLNF